MGVQVLDGKKPAEMPVGKISEGTPVVNPDVLATFGITVPDSLSGAEQVTTNAE